MATKRKAVNEKTCSSISEFTTSIEDLLRANTHPAVGNWYRGIGSIKHTLTPSLFRHPQNKTIEELMQLEATMLQDFERSSILHSERMSSSDEDGRMRTLFIMQHYGIPTRLLDWTPNPFISLYFALTSASPDAKGIYQTDAAVWVLDPVKWNRSALEFQNHGNSGPLVHSDALEGYAPRAFRSGGFGSTAIKSLQLYPSCLYGITNNARMFAQRGVFTIFGRNVDSMERQFANGSFPAESLTKIVIPSEKIAEILAMLLKLGYTDSVTYPDLSGLAMEIKRYHGFRV